LSSLKYSISKFYGNKLYIAEKTTSFIIIEWKREKRKKKSKVSTQCIFFSSLYVEIVRWQGLEKFQDIRILISSHVHDVRRTKTTFASCFSWIFVLFCFSIQFYLAFDILFILPILQKRNCWRVINTYQHLQLNVVSADTKLMSSDDTALLLFLFLHKINIHSIY
jgi:hypothetical protein